MINARQVHCEQLDYTQIIMVELVGNFAKTTSLHYSKWLFCVSITTSALFVQYFVRMIKFNDAINEIIIPNDTFNEYILYLRSIILNLFIFISVIFSS